MVDEFDEMVNAGRRRWMAAIIVNVILLAMIALAAHILFTRSGVITIQSIVASRTSQISADQEGRIARIFVEENQQFKRGQPLFEIENPGLLAKIDGVKKIIAGFDQQIAEEQSDLSRRLRESDLKMKIQSSKGQIEEKKVSLKNARQELDNADRLAARAKDELVKAELLFTSGAMTRARVESYRLAYENRLEDRKKTLGAIDLMETDIRGDEILLRSYADQMDALTSSTAQRVNELTEKKTAAKSELATLESARERLVYRTDRGGSVAVRRKEEGEIVKPGEAVIEVTTGEDLWVEAYFRSEDVSVVRVGERLVVRYGVQTFAATVESIGLVTKPFPVQRAMVMVVPENLVVVKLLFVEPNQAKKAGLRPGMVVTTEMTRQEGFLYRLGLKRAKSSDPMAPPREQK
jgi:multidrug resistance efflux pump